MIGLGYCGVPGPSLPNRPKYHGDEGILSPILLSPFFHVTPDPVDLPELLRTVLPYLRPAEQAVYLRLWHLAGGQGTCSVRYDDLCHSAHVSTSTLKRALKTLAHKKLLKVTFQAKHATQFQVWERPLTPKGQPTLGFTNPNSTTSSPPKTAASSSPASEPSPPPPSKP